MFIYFRSSTSLSFRRLPVFSGSVSGGVRSRLSKEGVPARETFMVQQAFIKRCGLPDRLRVDRQALTEDFNAWIGFERRPPHNKVHPGVALALRLLSARMHPRALRIAVPTLAWEDLADLARRMGLLETAAG